MTAEAERSAIIEQLEAALEATDADAKNFHIREAIQLLQIQDRTASTNAETADEMTK